MKAHSIHIGRVIAVAILAVVGVATPARSQDARTNVIPMIQMEGVPLLDAIRLLATQAGLNYIIDPRVAGASLDPSGMMVPRPPVTVRLENVTPDRALNEILTTHQLVMVESPATSIARIAPRDLGIKPVDPSRVGADTNVVGLFSMEGLPLDQTIRVLAAGAHLNVVIDPKINQAVAVYPDGRIMPPFTVSIRWRNVTAKQALAALLDNYELEMIADPATSTNRITIKTPGA